MIDYNPKSWWKLIFMFHRSDSFRILLPVMLMVAVWTGIVAYIEKEVLHAYFKNATLVHSLVGFILSLLLVFRTNTAYERWWEGRKIWGSIINNSRSLALKIHSLVGNTATRTRFRILITNLVYAMRGQLQGGVKFEDLENADNYPLDSFREKKHISNAILGALYAEIEALYRENKITPEHRLILDVELRSFTDNMGACERILRTPIPYSYSLFLKKVIFIYTLTMPIGFVAEFQYWSILIIPFIFYIFASIEVIAEEIEEPFGEDSNDLPMERMCATIKADVAEILGEK